MTKVTIKTDEYRGTSELEFSAEYDTVTIKTRESEDADPITVKVSAQTLLNIASLFMGKHYRRTDQG